MLLVEALHEPAKQLTMGRDVEPGLAHREHVHSELRQRVEPTQGTNYPFAGPLQALHDDRIDDTAAHALLQFVKQTRPGDFEIHLDTPRSRLGHCSQAFPVRHCGTDQRASPHANSTAEAYPADPKGWRQRF